MSSTVLNFELQWGINPLSMPTQSLCKTWVKACLENVTTATELTLRIVSAEESQTLNNTYRNKNKPTNVLSFEFSPPPYVIEPDVTEADEQATYLGDLAICAEVVVREAQQQHKTLEAHWAHMVVHGVLHLQGFDHIEFDDATEMEALEVKIMAKLGYANPYEI
ncbi:MAG: rRNA maturation RNase YbeY [Thiomicrorhabdus sp.]|nr:rRNA maturation RNase YbeY [Thiomicrorhabdus sp.]